MLSIESINWILFPRANNFHKGWSGWREWGWSGGVDEMESIGQHWGEWRAILSKIYTRPVGERERTPPERSEFFAKLLMIK
jgi:hypothetical protein